MRRGVTLLEVLFAIAIAAVGILGLMLTMVLAGRHASEGQTIDAADRLGRNAIRELQIRGYDTATGDRSTWAAVPVNGESYCLDPLGVASNPSVAAAAWFPAFDPATIPGPRMRRVSVRPFPGNQVTAPQAPVGLAFAQQLVTGADDLVFLMPNDRTIPPQQQFSGDPAVGLERRGTTGALSWFATFQSDDYAHSNALVHVVVCNRRDTSVASDRLLEVAAIDWPQVKIACRALQPDTDLAVAKGLWIMLAGQSPAGRHFSWYRVTNVGNVIPDGDPDIDGTVLSVPSRWVSVAGRDWPFTAAQTQVGIVDEAIAVYERPLRMNSSGI